MGRKNDPDNLASLPFLTTRRVCVLADCSKWTVLRSGLVPISKRGRTNVYKTEDVLAWLGGYKEETKEIKRDVAELKRAATSKSSDALVRLKEIVKGQRAR